MPTLTQLDYILAVHKHKHFGRAALECHVSQPSLSAQIQKVEEELGFIIFDRSKKPILTTQNGLELVDRAKKVMHEHRKLYEIKEQSADRLSGDFRLGVIPTLSPYLIPLFIEEFSRLNPHVQLSINEYKTEDIIRKLYDDELDGGLLVTPLDDDRLIERVLFYEPFYVFSSKQDPLVKKSNVQARELNIDNVWLLHEGHCLRDQVLNLCSQKSGHSSVLENISFESGSLETIINLVRLGRGFTLLPSLATQNLTATEKQKQLKQFKGSVPTREVSLVHSRSFLKEGILNSLEHIIIKNLPKSLKSLKKANLEVVAL